MTQSAIKKMIASKKLFIPEGSTKEEMITAIVAECEVSEEDANEIYDVMATVTKKPTLSITKPTGLVWYDEFHCQKKVKYVYDDLMNSNVTITIGWELGKKQHPKCVESDSAKANNSFLVGDGASILGVAYLPKDQYKNGDTFMYEDWAKEQGKDISRDFNVRLKNY